MESKKIVQIKWVDSFGCTSGWKPMEDYKPEVLICESVGYIVYEDDSIISIANSIAEETDFTIEQANGIMTIPKCSIKETISLTA